MRKYIKVGRVGRTTVHDTGIEAFGYRLFWRSISRAGYRFPSTFIFEKVSPPPPSELGRLVAKHLSAGTPWVVNIKPGETKQVNRDK